MRDEPTLRDTPREWPIHSTSKPFTGAKTGVTTDEVVMPDGGVARRDYQTHPGSVAIMAVDEDNRVLVINQYRHPVRHKLWEIPAGLLDMTGENPLSAARRELYEETHVTAGDWRVLVDLYSSPGGSDEAVRVYLARDLSAAERERYERTGEEADMELVRVPLARLVEAVLAGDLHNSAMMAGVLAYQAVLLGPGVESLRPAQAPWPARPYEPDVR